MSMPLALPPINGWRWFSATTRSVRRGPWRRWQRLFPLLYTSLALLISKNYIEWFSPTTILAALALFYTPTHDRKPTNGFRFGWLSLFFMAAFFLLRAQTAGFAALACAIGLYRENFYRRVAPTTPFILALLTPVTAWFADSFSFPIRLYLSALAGRLMTMAGIPVTVDGNVLTRGEKCFSVDPACMGLHMLIISLLSALLLANYFQQARQRRLPAWTIPFLLSGTIVLNILANLLRIICLVLLAIPPENPLHGALGLVFLGVYILLPLIPIIKWTITRFGKPVEESASPSLPRSRRALLANGVICSCLIIVTLTIRWTAKPIPPIPAQIPGYNMHQLTTGILQLENSTSMIYIKPIPAFYYTGHTPSICWQGSGYSFTSLQETTLSGIRVFEGTLQKDHEKLYTAWWYDNGIRQTIDPLDWRWDMLRGAPGYSIVNITTATREELGAQIIRIGQTHPFRTMLGHYANP